MSISMRKIVVKICFRIQMAKMSEVEAQNCGWHQITRLRITPSTSTSNSTITITITSTSKMKMSTELPYLVHDAESIKHCLGSAAAVLFRRAASSEKCIPAIVGYTSGTVDEGSVPGLQVPTVQSKRGALIFRGYDAVLGLLNDERYAGNKNAT
jgi:hypothetical protein